MASAFVRSDADEPGGGAAPRRPHSAVASTAIRATRPDCPCCPNLAAQAVTLAQGSEIRPGMKTELRKIRTADLRLTDVPFPAISVQEWAAEEGKTAHSLLMWPQGGQGCTLVNVVHYMAHLLGHKWLKTTRTGGNCSFYTCPALRGAPRAEGSTADPVSVNRVCHGIPLSALTLGLGLGLGSGLWYPLVVPRQSSSPRSLVTPRVGRRHPLRRARARTPGGGASQLAVRGCGRLGAPVLAPHGL